MNYQNLLGGYQLLLYYTRVGCMSGDERFMIVWILNNRSLRPKTRIVKQSSTAHTSSPIIARFRSRGIFFRLVQQTRLSRIVTVITGDERVSEPARAGTPGGTDGGFHSHPLLPKQLYNRVVLHCVPDRHTCVEDSSAVDVCGLSIVVHVYASTKSEIPPHWLARY